MGTALRSSPVVDETREICQNKPMRPAVIDVFCGIGALSYGFQREGFRVLTGIDSDASCRFVFETNVRGAAFQAEDVTRISATELRRRFASHPPAKRILIGCAPCTPFSMYVGRYKKKRRKSDGRWQLLKEFGRLVLATKPAVISMENVPRLTRHPVFRQFVRHLRTAGYHVTFKVLRAHHFGVPQRRSRLVLLASRFGPIELPRPTHRETPLTVRQAIGHLPAIKAGESCPRDRLHRARGLSEQNLRRIKSTVEGGSWRDWDSRLQLDCHRRKAGKSFRSVYGRMRWDAPSPVITTQCLGIGNGRFGHPKQHRAISIREAAILQTFPKAFRFVPPRAPISGLQLARQIGNAVPVRLARLIARAIQDHLALHEKAR